jgi:hypothetical protein
MRRYATSVTLNGSVVQDALEWARMMRNPEEYDAVIYVDFETGDVQLETEPKSQRDSRTMDVYHGHAGHYLLNTVPNALHAAELFETGEGRDLVERIMEGYDSEWDGRNMVGVFTEDAREAFEDLERLIDIEQEPGGALSGEGVTMYSAYEWFKESPPEAEMLTSIDLIETDLREEAEDEGVILYDLVDYLQTLQDEFRREGKED